MSKQLKLPTLLIVSENPTVRFWVKKHLDEKFFIIQAEKREEAISALSAALDFIIVDDAMESSDPLELCKDLNALTHKQLTPILLITGKLKKSFRDQAKTLGVTDFLSDQLEAEELKTLIDKGLKGASIRKKTENLIQSIHPTPIFTNHSLKNKIILNDKAVRLFATAKKKKTSTCGLILRIDDFNAIYRNNLKNREFGKEAPQNSHPERMTIAEKQGMSEDENFEGKPTKRKTDSSGCFGIKAKETMKNELWEYLNDLLREQDALLTLPDGYFVILLANTSKQNGKIISERLLEKIKNSLKITISIVIDLYAPDEHQFHQKIEAAKERLNHLETPNQILDNDPS